MNQEHPPPSLPRKSLFLISYCWSTWRRNSTQVGGGEKEQGEETLCLPWMHTKRGLLRMSGWKGRIKVTFSPQNKTNTNITDVFFSLSIKQQLRVTKICKYPKKDKYKSTLQVVHLEHFLKLCDRFVWETQCGLSGYSLIIFKLSYQIWQYCVNNLLDVNNFKHHWSHTKCCCCCFLPFLELDSL